MIKKLLLLLTVLHASLTAAADVEIRYETTDNQKIEINADAFNPAFNSHEQIQEGNKVVNVLSFNVNDGETINITDYAFYYCETLKGIEFPNTVSCVIGNSAFSQCANLESIELVNVSEIGDLAFGGCTNLKEVVISSSDSNKAGSIKIGVSAFINCSNLEVVKINREISEFGQSVFWGCDRLERFEGIYNDKLDDRYFLVIDKKLVAYAPFHKDGLPDASYSITIPEYITAIGSTVFAGNQWLSSVTFNNQITEVAGDAFLECSNLQAFYGENVSSDNHCLIIGDKLVAYAGQEYKYTIPSNVKVIGDLVFCRNRFLDNLIIPEGVTEIGFGAFSGSDICDVHLPGTLKTIGANAFNQCHGIESIELPDGLAEIKDGAFSLSALKMINIPGTVEKIGDFAFENCNYLQKIIIQEGVKEIGEFAFYLAGFYAEKTDITLPSSIEKIGGVAFDETNKQTSLYCLTPTLPQLGYHTFDQSMQIYLHPTAYQQLTNQEGNYKDWTINVEPIQTHLNDEFRYNYEFDYLV